MKRNVPDCEIEAREASHRIREAFQILRRGDPALSSPAAQQILQAQPDIARVQRVDLFIESFCALLQDATTECLYPGDQPLTHEDVAYVVVREMLWRYASEVGTEAAQATADGAMEVVADQFGSRDEHRRSPLATEAD